MSRITRLGTACRGMHAPASAVFPIRPLPAVVCAVRSRPGARDDREALPVVAAPDEFQLRPADVAGASSPAGGEGWRRRLMTLIWCAGRGRVTLTSAPLADWHGALACRVVLRLGSDHGAGAAAREALGLTSDVAYLAGMLFTGASIAVWTASSRMGNAPGDKAGRWGICAGLWGPHLHGPLATPSKPTRSVESSAERAAPGRPAGHQPSRRHPRCGPGPRMLTRPTQPEPQLPLPQ